MCELNVILKGNTVMEDVVRIKAEDGSITLYGMLGDVKTVSGRIVEVNMTKQQVIIGS